MATMPTDVIKYPSADKCPDRAMHSPYPADFNHGSRTHIQRRCPTCGYWAIWVPRKGLIQTLTEVPR